MSVLPEASKPPKAKQAAKEPEPKSILEQWEAEGTPVKYARFHQPCPPVERMEPVSEFRVEGPKDKYIVTSMVYTPHGLIWRHKDELNITALANIVYCRFVVKTS